MGTRLGGVIREISLASVLAAASMVPTIVPAQSVEPEIAWVAAPSISPCPVYVTGVAVGRDCRIHAMPRFGATQQWLCALPAVSNRRP